MMEQYVWANETAEHTGHYGITVSPHGFSGKRPACHTGSFQHRWRCLWPLHHGTPGRVYTWSRSHTQRASMTSRTAASWCGASSFVCIPR